MHQPPQIADCTSTCVQVDTKGIMGSKEAFEESLGMSGRELLQAGIASAIAVVRALACMTRAASGQE